MKKFLTVMLLGVLVFAAGCKKKDISGGGATPGSDIAITPDFADEQIGRAHV